jgi:hypothetical protein
VAGRFSKHHKRCITEEDNKSNNRLIDKLLMNTDVSISVKLVNAIIFIVISLLIREDPLSTGILDVFFSSKILYHVSLLVSEFIYLNIAQIFNRDQICGRL